MEMEIGEEQLLLHEFTEEEIEELIYAYDKFTYENQINISFSEWLEKYVPD